MNDSVFVRTRMLSVSVLRYSIDLVFWGSLWFNST